MKKVAVLQSNYIPWKGYFDIIHDVDLFLLYDEVQYTKNDWRNRNKIMTPQGPRWITLPCGYNLNKTIREVTFNPEIDWQKQHFDLIKRNYKDAPHFKKYKDFFEYVYLEAQWEYLHDLNKYLIHEICEQFLGIKTKLDVSENFFSEGVKQKKLLSLLESVGTSYYVSGPAAQSYIVPEEFARHGIEVVFKDYAGYPEYPQLHGQKFDHHVSIIDLLFNVGEDAPYYIWGHREGKRTE